MFCGSESLEDMFSHYQSGLDIVLNTVLLLGKFFMHTCKYLKSKPSLTHRKNELKLTELKVTEMCERQESS